MKLTYLLGCAAALSLTASMAPVSVAFAASGAPGNTCGGGDGGAGGGGAGGVGTCTPTPTLTNSAPQSFQVTGTVNSSCVLGNFQDVTLGTIPINQTAGSSSLFKLTSTMSQTGPGSSGGCNDGVVVTVTKTNGALGMQNTSAVGYDSTIFQANLPYAVTVGWTGPDAGATTSTGQSVTVASNLKTNSSSQKGAFISNLTSSISVPPTTLGLLGGYYTDTVTVQLLVQ